MNNQITNEMENDHLLYSILDKRFFQNYKEPIGSPKKANSQLELFITNECNLKCSYCYLHHFGKQLYPYNGNNPKKIIENLNILFEHFLEESYTFDGIDLFSGEIWGDYLGNEVLNTILSYIKKGVIVTQIVIPTNFSFLLDEKKTNHMIYYIEEFKKNNSCLQLSVSIDGKMLEDQTRPFKYINAEGKVKLRDDEFYEKLFSFCKKNNFKYHPMVASYGIDKWIDNYKWYKKQLYKHGYEDPINEIMMLEVRNDDWTEEAIAHYIKFIDYLIEDKFNDLNRDIVAFTKFLFNIDGSAATGYLPYHLALAENSMPCTIQQQMTVRLGDLSIVGCHRIAYDQFVFGSYKLENNKIVGIKANNPQMAAKVILCNPMNSIHGCDRCRYKKLCMKGCFGSQFEAGNDPFMPIQSVCNLFEAKINFLLEKYNNMGVFNVAQKLLESDLNYYNIKAPLDIYLSVLKGGNDLCQS